MQDSTDPLSSAVPPGAEPPGLYETLAARARASSDASLAACAGVGLVPALALAVLRPGWWALTLPLVAVGSFGVWGIADRERADPRAGRSAGARRALHALALLAAVIGTAAALAALFGVVGVMLGTIIS